MPFNRMYKLRDKFDPIGSTSDKSSQINNNLGRTLSALSISRSKKTACMSLPKVAKCRAYWLSWRFGSYCTF